MRSSALEVVALPISTLTFGFVSIELVIDMVCDKSAGRVGAEAVAKIENISTEGVESKPGATRTRPNEGSTAKGGNLICGS